MFFPTRSSSLFSEEAASQGGLTNLEDTRGAICRSHELLLVRYESLHMVPQNDDHVLALGE